MKAVLKHELRIYFHSLTAYIFGAFLLAFVGIGAVLYNLQAAVSNFEFVLNFSNLIFVVIVPILTMRVIAEERKQKTDQLLYALPITTSQVVLGKYFALLTVYLIPLLIISIYPLIFSRFGEVYLPTSYGSILSFFIMGSALLALGVFISSLTENQGFAAGIGIAIILLNFYSVRLSEYVSSTALGSAIAMSVIIIALAAIIRYLTKNTNLAYGFCIIFIAIILITYYVDMTILEGLLPDIMKKLSLFDRFNVFVNGIFDMTSIVYYLTLIVFFLFLSVQSLEKRRYN
jgi:ABC-2 type transport system permease protein